jgi:hypothetical protein
MLRLRRADRRRRPFSPWLASEATNELKMHLDDALCLLSL